MASDIAPADHEYSTEGFAAEVVFALQAKPVPSFRGLDSKRPSPRRTTRQLPRRLPWASWRGKRRLARKYSQGVFLFALCCLIVWNLCLAPYVWDEIPAERRLLEPEDQFSNDDRRRGAVVLHTIGLFYMFIAIAIVCDECFVPALEVISEVLELRPDVAGATFMAAGGSAPEFFTSLIGTCVGSESDIGTGTIIGSAVFNVLFVIGACAIASPSPLELTWFPLARDATFYAFDLVIVTIVFLDEKVKWWEALLLFLCYIKYAIFMTFNERIETWVLGRTRDTEETATEVGATQPSTDEVNDDCWAKSREPSSDLSQRAQQASAGNVSIVSPDHPRHVASTEVVASGTGECFKEDEASRVASKDGRDGKGHVHLSRHGTEEVKRHSSHLNNQNQNQRTLFRHTSMRVANHQSHNLSQMKKGDTKDALGNHDSTGGSHNYSHRSTGEEAFTSRKGSKESGPPAPASSHPGTPAPSMPSGHAPRLVSDLELTDVVPHQEASIKSEITAPASMPVSNVLSTDVAVPDPCSEEAEEEEENEPLSIWPPALDAGTKDWLWYIVTFPIVFCLVFTVPDVRREGFRRFFVLTFTLSISWIAAFTWVMVWFATAISETCGLDEHIMGLTVLAAGTSVPDLLTSMIVAREGHGDMAVSSSIGSNIFDVTVGLPIPWLLYALIKNGKNVEIKNEALEICVMLLLAMLMFTVGTVMFHSWVMTKGMGASLLFLYFTFEVIAVALTFAPDGSLKLIHV